MIVKLNEKTSRFLQAVACIKHAFYLFLGMTSKHFLKVRILISKIPRLQDDLLLTHSAPAIMKKRPLDPKSKSTYIEPGELIIWRWLSVDRFFPPRPGQEDDPVPLSTIRGCSAVSKLPISVSSDSNASRYLCFLL